MAYATIRDVAQQAGVSVSTVSRALNDSGRISERTRARINQVIKELHYVPDSRARSMHSPHSRTIGLLIPDIRNSYFADLAYLIQGELLAHGFQTLICTSTQGDSHESRIQVRNLLGQHIDGAIIVPGPRSQETLDELTRRGLPVVYVDRTSGDRRQVDGRPVPSIDSDPLPGLRDAFKDLVKHGHSRITMVPGPLEESGTFREREEVFDDLLNQMDDLQDPTRDVACTRNDTPSEEGAFNPELLRQWRNQGVSAVIFGRSQDAIQVIKACQAIGIGIGRDLSIVTFDDLPVFRILTPAIATISQQIDSMGTRCVRMLLNLMAGSQTDSVRLKTKYLHRASVGQPPGQAGQYP